MNLRCRLSKGQVDRAITNPPYTRGADTQHLEQLVRGALEIPFVAVLNVTALAAEDRYRRVWARTGLFRVAHTVTRPRFSDKGGSRDVIAVQALPGFFGTWAGEHWPGAWQ